MNPSTTLPDRITHLRGRIRARLARVAGKTWALVGVLAATSLASTGLVAFAPTPDRRDASAVAVPVASAWVAPGSHSPVLGLYGRVETPNSASLTALASAPVAALAAREGDQVAAGDVLVRLDHTDARLLARRRQAELAEAEANRQALKLSGAGDREMLDHQQDLHRLAVNKVERHRQLFKQGSIAQETLNAAVRDRHAQAVTLLRQRNLMRGFEHRLARAEALVARARAALEEAEVGLARTIIRAPFAGRVTRIAVAPGEWVSPQRVVAGIYDDTALEIRVQIPESHLATLRQALAAGIRPRAQVDFGVATAGGWLDRLAGAVAKGQAGVAGLVRLDPATPAPDLGRVVNVRIALPAIADALTVPVHALYGHRRLFVIEDGMLVGVEVERLGETTGEDGEPRLLVRADRLRDGARILVSRLSNAVTGLRVSTGDARSLDSTVKVGAA